MLDGQRQSVDVFAYARAVQDGLPEKRLEEDLCWIVFHVPPMISPSRSKSWTEVNLLQEEEEEEQGAEQEGKEREKREKLLWKSWKHSYEPNRFDKVYDVINKAVMCNGLCITSCSNLRLLFIGVPAGSPSRGGDDTVYVLDINQPSLPTLLILFLCLFRSLWPFQLYFIR